MQRITPYPVLATVSILGICLSQFCTVAIADVSVPSLISDHMVVQRDKPVQIWGWADAGEAVRVEMAEQSAETRTGKDGHWQVALDPLPAGGPHTLKITGANELLFEDILVGEVWVASGQSNMQWTIGRSINADLARLSANRAPAIRFNRVANMGSQTPQEKTTNSWEIAAPNTVGNFSAVAYAFAETLNNVLGVPIGIIQNSWGGSAAEAWVPRPVIVNDPLLANIHEDWLNIEASYDFQAELAKYEEALSEWELIAEAARNSDEAIPRKPRKPQDRMTGQHRPGNLWNARILPISPVSMRGVIWYQGEANAHSIERAQQYEHLFSTLIDEWRNLWEESFPFYFVQLADYREESPFAVTETWAYLRNSQTATLNTVPNTGQAVITDLGEGKDIHPRAKEEVGRRLARWALNRDYGHSNLACRSPELDSWSQKEATVVVNFNYTGAGLRPFDTNEVHGFVVQSEDGAWHIVQGKVKGTNSVVLNVQDGMLVKSVGYAWANNPICNLFTIEGLPVTPFRTDVD